MEFESVIIKKVHVVAVGIDVIDAANSAGFKCAIGDKIKENPKLVLDLSKTRFVDSSGCGALLSCLRNATAAGGDLKLCCVQKPVRALFELIRLHHIVELYENNAEAVASYL